MLKSKLFTSRQEIISWFPPLDGNQISSDEEQEQEQEEQEDSDPYIGVAYGST